jgi:hypothetical protein
MARLICSIVRYRMNFELHNLERDCYLIIYASEWCCECTIKALRPLSGAHNFGIEDSARRCVARKLSHRISFDWRMKHHLASLIIISAFWLCLCQ